MANQKQLKLLTQGGEAWNKWRARHRRVVLDLREANLYQADLQGADLREANLSQANLMEADLSRANLRAANLSRANLSRVNFREADLRQADLWGSRLWEADLSRADLRGANLNRADLSQADISQADLSTAKLGRANLIGTNLIGANLSQADLKEADLRQADLSQANLWGADLKEANLGQANLSGADLTGADLREAILVHTQVDKAKASGSRIYGVNVWDLRGDFEEQKDLVITPEASPSQITVDNIKVAQFIYLILNNEAIRDVINTLTSKSVLILGRFSIPERKGILDALRNKLREYNLLPIVFDFDRPTDKDFTETIKTLAGLCYFVIADITNPKSSPLELQATVPDYQIPFVPIIQEGEQPFAMMVDLQKKYPWVLDTLSYNSIETLIKALKPAIIDPAIQKHNELRLIKAREPKIRLAEDFIDDAGLE
jgi:uncharacterized protein YjbI with pentapeptide repeats